MFNISISKQVKKNLDLLDDNFVKIFYEKAKILANDPFNHQINLDIKKLNGFPQGFYRLRLRNYRFLYEVRKNELLIFFFKMDTRGDIYKN